MTGSVRICDHQEKRQKHEHVCFELSNGKSLRFQDPRRFGHISACKIQAKNTLPSSLLKLGIEPLSNKFTGTYLLNTLKNRTLPIKTALMDNKIVVGIGNIYANESLFESNILPQTKANTITIQHLDRLVKNIKNILKQAIAAGGTTIADFKGLNGQEGKFAINLKVYGRNQTPCTICQTPIVKIKQSGRSTFFCPKCQK
jgi:formamidopyrimidine-DNA glycosylase